MLVDTDHSKERRYRCSPKNDAPANSAQLVPVPTTSSTSRPRSERGNTGFVISQKVGAGLAARFDVARNVTPTSVRSQLPPQRAATPSPPARRMASSEGSTLRSTASISRCRTVGARHSMYVGRAAGTPCRHRSTARGHASAVRYQRPERHGGLLSTIPGHLLHVAVATVVADASEDPEETSPRFAASMQFRICVALY